MFLIGCALPADVGFMLDIAPLLDLFITFFFPQLHYNYLICWHKNTRWCGPKHTSFLKIDYTSVSFLTHFFTHHASILVFSNMPSFLLEVICLCISLTQFRSFYVWISRGYCHFGCVKCFMTFSDYILKRAIWLVFSTDFKNSSISSFLKCYTSLHLLLVILFWTLSFSNSPCLSLF